ncbi:putative nitrogen assimilation transcription factor [Triangularia verruculosa]|uniref:Nitrogen assimilation transcription factor n=1 Tax=Triangularia verruculosa TaxID=2587418 RepID=A0AAN7ANC2_9PEZI|nr:putative nitrogen assimilation transcription factor [Triangularia verruculosa]
MSSSRSASPFDKLNYGTSSLRRLMPASHDEAASEASVNLETSPIPASSAGGPAPPRRKRQATTAACRACRKRKSRCDGARPTCSVCRDRKTRCEFDTIAATETHTQALKRKYTELQQQKTAFEQIYEVLRSRPEKEAEEVLQRIRRGADANSVLRHVTMGDVLLQLSLVPETRFRYEFPYLTEMPIYLQKHDNPYLDSEVFDCALRGAVGQQQQQQQRALPSVNGMLDSPPGAFDQRDPYLKPYSSAIVVDPWLDSLTPSNWTLVSSDNNFMRQVIHDYFLYDYDWFTFFHKDYFLQDMANDRQRFCSRLLVNAVLCIGCYCHQKLPGRSESWNPKNIGYQFLAEAKRLFEVEVEAPRPSRDDPEWKQRDWECRQLTTIHAALLLNVIYNLNGSDRLGWRYAIRAVELANEIQLFQASPAHLSSEIRCVREFTAWCLFAWQSLSVYHYLKPPILTRPPDIPLPDPSENPQWWGELWIRYPQTPARLPTYHGHLTKARFDYWAIMNDFSLRSFSQPLVKVPLDQVVGFYHRLRGWWTSLPEPLTPKRLVLPHHLKVHMHYNCVLIDLLKPLLGLHHPDATQPTTNKTLDDAHHEACIHLETLLRVYYLRHGFEAFDGFLTHFLGSLNFIKINTREMQNSSLLVESHRSTILLLMKGLRDQGQCHTVARVVLRLQAHLMRPDDVELLKRFVDIEAEKLVCGPEMPGGVEEEEVILSDWPMYDVGLEEKAEQRSRGVDFASMVREVRVVVGGEEGGKGGDRGGRSSAAESV